jgi:hypothetical protein
MAHSLSFLSQKAMLVHLKINQWTARKFDKDATTLVASNYSIDETVGRYNKELVPKKAIRKIQKAVSALRAYHYDNTLPWGDNTRLLPAANYMAYTAEVRNLKSDFEAAVAEFVANYQNYITEAQNRLGALFNYQEYPGISQIAGLYGVDVQINPLPEVEDFRVMLQEDDVKQIKKDIEDRMSKAQEDAMLSLWQRLYDTVSNMAKRLSDTDSTFHDTLVSNISDLVNLLPRLNIANDAGLEQMRQEIHDKLCVYSPKELRKDGIVRTQVAQDATKILEDMAGYMGIAQPDKQEAA